MTYNNDMAPYAQFNDKSPQGKDFNMDTLLAWCGAGGFIGLILACLYLFAICHGWLPA